MRFARAASKLQGIRFLGLVHTPPGGDDANMYADVVRITNPMDTKDLIAGVEELKRRRGQPYRIIGILEAMMVQMAEVRAHFGVDGTQPRVADLFREKARMKEALTSAGLPVARNRLLRSLNEAQTFAKEIGFPLVIKPPAGMGGKSTFRIRSLPQLLKTCSSMGIGPNRPLLCEEFLRGREFSFETITVNGEVKMHSISHYMPSCLEAIETPWVQWCCLLPRKISGPEYDGIRKIGFAAVKALGLRDGMTHMEWFQRPDGSLAIGEIAQRPPGANISIMNAYAYDFDLYRAWARAVVDNACDGPFERKYAVGTAFLRGMGRGRVASVTGIHETYKAVGQNICEAKLPTIGAPKSDSYEGDGYIVVRHPDTEMVKRMLKTIIETVRVTYLD